MSLLQHNWKFIFLVIMMFNLLIMLSMKVHEYQQRTFAVPWHTRESHQTLQTFGEAVEAYRGRMGCRRSSSKGAGCLPRPNRKAGESVSQHSWRSRNKSTTNLGTTIKDYPVQKILLCEVIFRWILCQLCRLTAIKTAVLIMRHQGEGIESVARGLRATHWPLNRLADFAAGTPSVFHRLMKP